MPLSCDCYGGCWGEHSKGWPEVEVPVGLIHDYKTKHPYETYFAQGAAYEVISHAEIPYGSYVQMTGFVRLETEDLARKFADTLEAAAA